MLFRSAIYFYRADINAWQLATGLALSSELPLNARYNGPFSAMLAERLVPLFPQAQLPPLAMARISRARASLYVQSGVARDPVRAEYF